MKRICRKNIARLVAGVVNPFLGCTVLVFLVLLENTDNLKECIQWFILSIAISVVPILLIISYLVKLQRLDDIFITVRVQRNKVYAISVVLVGIDCAVLYFLGASLMLVALFVTVFLTGLIFAVVNRWWKISIHTAAIAIVILALLVLYGQKAAVAVVLAPLVAWSRVEIEHHSIAQVIAGGIWAGSIILLVYSLFDLV
jgi:membrane-associated phospholipid phosphatase